MIAPALARGADVVCDRYLDSSLAYQGIARGLGLERVLELNLHATGGVLPGSHVPAPRRPAARRRSHAAEPATGSSARTRTSARASTAPTASSPTVFPNRITTIDGNRPPDEIAERDP